MAYVFIIAVIESVRSESRLSGGQSESLIAHVLAGAAERVDGPAGGGHARARLGCRSRRSVHDWRDVEKVGSALRVQTYIILLRERL